MWCLLLLQPGSPCVPCCGRFVGSKAEAVRAWPPSPAVAPKPWAPKPWGEGVPLRGEAGAEAANTESELSSLGRGMAGTSEQQGGTPHLHPPRGWTGTLSWVPGTTATLEGPQHQGWPIYIEKFHTQNRRWVIRGLKQPTKLDPNIGRKGEGLQWDKQSGQAPEWLGNSTPRHRDIEGSLSLFGALRASGMVGSLPCKFPQPLAPTQIQVALDGTDFLRKKLKFKSCLDLWKCPGASDRTVHIWNYSVKFFPWPRTQSTPMEDGAKRWGDTSA